MTISIARDKSFSTSYPTPYHVYQQYFDSICCSPAILSHLLIPKAGLQAGLQAAQCPMTMTSDL